MSKRIEELLEEYSSNRKQYTGEKHFKFLKKVFKAFKEVGALNISFIYYTLNSNSPKIMDSEFIKAYTESMLKDNHTLINIFTGYWENNRGLELTEGLNVNFNMILKEEEVFAALVANNELEKVLQLLSITYYRIKSLTQDTTEDLFYSKCLSDYEREDFKNAVSGLQFFGFSKKEKEEKARKKFERELYSEMELEYIKDKSNGLAKDIKMLQDEVVDSLKKQNVFKIPQDLNRDAIDLTVHAPTGEDINLSNPDKKTLDSILNNDGKISFLQFDSREGKFSIQKESDYDEEDGWMDISSGVDDAVTEAFAKLEISDKIDYGDNDSWVEYYINIKTLFNLNDKYKKLFDKRVEEELSATSGLQFDIYDYLPELPKKEKEKREKIKKLKEEIDIKNEQWKKEGKGFFERMKLRQKAWKEGYDKIVNGYNIDISKMDSDGVSPLTDESIAEYSKLNTEAFKAIREAYKKYSKIQEWQPLKQEAPNDEWGTWNNFIAGKLDTYTIALVSWDQEDWSDFGEELIDAANAILSKKGYGENILSIGGDGDEGIIDIDISSAKINFDNLK